MKRHVGHLLLVAAIAAVMLFVAGAVAQATNPQAPSSWVELFMLVTGGVFGIPAVIKAIRGGIDWKTLVASGTVWTSLSGIFTAIGLYLGGSIPLPTLIGSIYLAVALIFLRNAQANNGQATVAWWNGDRPSKE